MVKNLFVIWLAIASSFVYADYSDVVPNKSCVYIAQLYSFVAKVRTEKTFTEMQILKILGVFLTKEDFPSSDIAEILNEARKVYKDKTLTEYKTIIKYLQLCGGVQI